MKKKVDSRVRALLESGVSLKERSLLVLVGDRSREQIPNLHYLLSAVGPHTKPSVLWCYKKELGFSSHRKKRQKQLQHKIKQGLYNPNLDNPFELFICSTNIRYLHYKDTQQALGKTYDVCILQDFEALTPNILCRVIETAAGGGLVLLLLQSVESLTQLYSLTMDIHSRYKTEAFSSIDPRFNMRMLLSLVSCRRCLVLDDELNILPINGGEALETASPALQQQQQQRLQQQQQQQELLQQIISKVQHAPPLDALVRLCVSPDQATAVIAFLDCLCSCSSFRSKLQEEASQQQPPAAAAPAAGVGTAAATGAFQTVALTAARGRGKSAALGLAVAAAVALGVS